MSLHTAAKLPSPPASSLHGDCRKAAGHTAYTAPEFAALPCRDPTHPGRTQRPAQAPLLSAGLPEGIPGL